MYCSASLSCLCIHSTTRLLYSRKNFWFSPFRHRRSFRTVILPQSVASASDRNLQLSWFSPATNAPNDYNGWAVLEAPPEELKTNTKKGLPVFAVIGLGASFAALLGVFAYITLLRKGFKFRLGQPLNGLHERLIPQVIDNENDESHHVDSDESVAHDESVTHAKVSEGTSENVPATVDETLASEVDLGTEKVKPGHVIIRYAMDSTQQEAISVLKKLKVVDDDVKADDLCTRREYARWLVQLNSQLERTRKRKLIPPVALCGSSTVAFGDVSIQDPDFEPIQCLAEAGIVPSKLSFGDLSSNGQEINFYPERFISRQDLICWKTKLEYEVMPGIDQEVSRKNIGFLDLRDIGSEALVDLYIDILADQNSIIRRVFGQSKRFQPSKPSTKAQAAVALTSGNMIELINAELSKQEGKATSRQMAMEEIRSEILERGDVQKYWERRMEEERSHLSIVEMDYRDALSDLEKERVIQENARSDLMKQEAALECQKQLLSTLKNEVNETSDRLKSERTSLMNEQLLLQGSLRELHVKLEGLHDAKSILEAEIEALRILRSWIEDEARKSQSRAKVLEEAGRRWRWNG